MERRDDVFQIHQTENITPPASSYDRWVPLFRHDRRGVCGPDDRPESENDDRDDEDMVEVVQAETVEAQSSSSE